MGPVQKNKQFSLLDWQLGKTRVFLKYWHPDVLNSLMDRWVPFTRGGLVSLNTIRCAVHVSLAITLFWVCGA